MKDGAYIVSENDGDRGSYRSLILELACFYSGVSRLIWNS